MEPTLAPNAAFATVILLIMFASAVKGTLGFGFPLLAVPIAANLLGARTAIVLIALPALFGNLLMFARGGGRLAQVRQFAGLLAAVIVGAAIGAQFLHRLNPGALAIVVGITVLLFAAFGLFERTPTISRQAQAFAGPLVGLVTGIMGGTTAIFAPVVTAYLHALRLEKREFVFWLTAAFLVGGTSQVITYYHLGLYAQPMVSYALVACLPVIAGTRLGFWIQDRLRPELFRRAVLLLVLASALNLIVRQLI